MYHGDNSETTPTYSRLVTKEIMVYIGFAVDDVDDSFKLLGKAMIFNKFKLLKEGIFDTSLDEPKTPMEIYSFLENEVPS
jgi:hypothetical protein